MSSRTKDRIYICPLYGWHRGEARLSQDLTIRRVDYAAAEPQLFMAVGLRPVNYQFVLEARLGMGLDEVLWGIESKVRSVEEALRVFGEGMVGLAAIIPKSGPGSMLLDSRAVNVSQGYQVTNAQVKELAVFYKKFEVARSNLPLAFFYFSDSYRQHGYLVKVIFYSIVLEALFVPHDARGEKYIFIKQAMCILGFSEKEIEQTKKLYELRNAILHANQKQQTKLYASKQFNFSWFEETETLIRRILQVFVERPW